MCLEKLGKIFLIAANIAFFIGGLALLIIGIISIVKVELLYDLANLLTDDLGRVFEELHIVTELDLVGLIKANSTIICVVGGVLFGIGFLGMCGACQMNATCLLIYAVIVLVLLMAEVGLGVYAYMNADKFENQIQQGLRLAMSREYEEGYRFDDRDNLIASKKIEETGIDLLQIYLQCCGVANRSDWLLASNWNRNYTGHADPAMVPPSCCKLNARPEGTNFTVLPTTAFTGVDTCIQTGTGATVNDKYCYDELRDIILKNQTIIIVVFVIIVFVEFLAVTVACYLKGEAEKKK